MFPAILNKFILLLSISLLPLLSLALDSDRLKPAEFSAENVVYNHQTRIGIYTNHVYIIQGTTHIAADKIVSYNNKNNQLTKAIATGNPAKFQTRPKLNQSLLYAQAQQIEYYPLTHLVILRGNAIVRQNKNKLSGPWLSYNLQTGIAKASGKQQRTTLFIE